VNFKIDENLPKDVGILLENAGHDAVTVLDQKMQGVGDPRLATLCRTENRVLLTLDIDFADIRTYPPAEYAGLIVLRLRFQDKTHVLDVVRRLLHNLPQHTKLDGMLWIVDEHRIRERD
jgi:predicted nuclease of predicted toxin-antitoxin system